MSASEQGGTTMFGLDLTGKWVVAVGGGVVGTRWILDLLQRGARVRLISPAVSPQLRQLIAEDAISWVPRVYVGSPDLAGAWLVHTATGVAKVDARVARDAESTRTWCINAGDVPARRPRNGNGKVALVGGGPGDDGLLTVRGAQLLAAADVVLVDRLAPRGLLANLPSEVEIIDVGKDVGEHAVPQERINDLLIQQARAGRAVVRLKGGDPYVLGRGGEERLACERAGIEVEVVSGVTSAIAVPAAAGIPLTHRGVARGFSVVTGHDQIGAVPTSRDHTVVLLMGVARLRETARSLMAAGRVADSPVAIIERGFLPGQRTTVGTVEQIAARAEAVGVRSPAVIVIGDVVRLSPAWRAAPLPAVIDTVSGRA